MNNCVIFSKNIVRGDVKMKGLIGFTGCFLFVCIIITSVIIPSLPHAGAIEKNINVDTESVVQNDDKTSKDLDEKFTIKEYNGKVAVFENDSEKPSFVSDVSVNNLPKADQSALKKGIEVNSKRALNRLVEDYCS